MTAQYRLLQPHYVLNAYLDQGTTVTEGVQIPVGWVPTLNVDPLNSDAVTAFYNAGPRGLGWEQFNEFGAQNYLFPTPATKPVTYWVLGGTGGSGFSLGFSPGFGGTPVAGGNRFWSLTGLGVLYRPVPAV